MAVNKHENPLGRSFDADNPKLFREILDPDMETEAILAMPFNVISWLRSLVGVEGVAAARQRLEEVHQTYKDKVLQKLNSEPRLYESMAAIVAYAIPKKDGFEQGSVAYAATLDALSEYLVHRNQAEVDQIEDRWGDSSFE